MLESIHFMYDNISSKDMGIQIASTRGGLFEENFLPRRRIIEKKLLIMKNRIFKRLNMNPSPLTCPFILKIGLMTTI